MRVTLLKGPRNRLAVCIRELQRDGRFAALKALDDVGAPLGQREAHAVDLGDDPVAVLGQVGVHQVEVQEQLAAEVFVSALGGG